MALKTPISKDVMDSLSDYIANNIAAIFNPNNTATGATSATLNTASGVVTFTTLAALAPASRAYTITNSLVTTTSTVDITVKNGNGSTGIASFNGYYTTNGSIVIFINDAANGTGGKPIVSFKILG